MAQTVQIGQTWERKTHARYKPQIVLTQVHRADREIEARPAEVYTTAMLRLSFSELRRRYRLVGVPAAVAA